MSEPFRDETQRGIADLKRRLNAAGLNIVKQEEDFRRGSTLFVIGNDESQTDIVLSEEFIHDLPNTKEYQAMVDSYARAVAGRLKCGSPELFYCKSDVAIQVSFRWPIQSAVYNNELVVFLLMDVTNIADGKIAKCSVQLGGGKVFAAVVQAVNSVRSAVDAGQIKFHEPTVHQDVFQRAETKRQPQEHHSQPDVENFVAGKAYTLGFIAVDEARDIWSVDPWDAQYLGVTVKELSLAMRVLRAKGLLQAGARPDYVRPTDDLLAEHSSRRAKKEEAFSLSQQTLSRTSLPNKDDLLKDMQNILKQHPTSALVVIDLDNFKAVNDTKSHSEGDACLDKVIATIGAVVGRRGKIYRWGSGDEFIVFLPEFSTTEAEATAERIRSSVEQAKPGGDIEVTTSIGVCGTDCAKSKSPEEILDFADKAMYQSKHEKGKNCVTVWPIEANVASLATTAMKPTKQSIKAQLAAFLKSGQEIQNGLHYNIFDCIRQKQEWELRVEEYLERNLDGSYAVRFQTPGHPPTTYPDGINEKMKAPWANTGAKMMMLNSFMAELRD